MAQGIVLGLLSKDSPTLNQKVSQKLKDDIYGDSTGGNFISKLLKVDSLKSPRNNKNMMREDD